MLRAIAIGLGLLASAVAADDDVASAVDAYLDTVVVTASRRAERTFDTPASADAVTSQRLERQSYRTTPQALRDVPGVMVQETAAGQGSPFLRGFTGYRTLILIDGIRLNNSVFRSGPNQYANTIDPFSLDRIEVVKGPSSVLYGADAIGGTIQAITRAIDRFAGHGGRLFYRGATAEHSHIGRAEFVFGFRERTGVAIGLTGKSYGDLEAGAPVGTQTNVGYTEWDGDVKIEHFLDDDTRIVAAFQQVRQNNVPRTHRTTAAVPFDGTTVGSELRRDLDQERRLTYVQLHMENREGLIEVLRASLSWQRQEEVRDRLRTSGRDLQGFEVDTFGFWVQLESDTTWGRFTYGFEVYHDEVDSFSSRNPIQGPIADDATYDLLGLYVQDVVDVSRRFVLTLGVRLTYAAADADSVEDPETGNPISLSEDWTAVVGSIRALYKLVEDRWNLFGGVSQGFRPPNLSDLTRFDSARSDEFEIPAPGLDPEYYTTFEAGVKGRRDGYSVELTTYYTVVRDQIVRFPTGNTNDGGDFEVTKDNVGDGWVYGIEAAGAVRVAPEWTVFGNLAYLQGKVDTFPTSMSVATRDYLSRLMPLTAQVGVRWDDPTGEFWAEVRVVMAARADQLSIRDQGDSQRIPPGGTPGYGVVHVRAGWNASERARLGLAVDNVLDHAYRVHGSGITMPGLNFVFWASFEF